MEGRIGVMEYWSFGVLVSSTPSLRHSITPLAPYGARLVSEERSECRDDRSKSGIDEFLNHVLDVLVSGGSLFIEQVPLFANDPATQRCLSQLMHPEAFAHTLTSFAPGPFAARTVSQRPGTAFAITQRLDQVTE